MNVTHQKLSLHQGYQGIGLPRYRPVKIPYLLAWPFYFWPTLKRTADPGLGRGLKALYLQWKMIPCLSCWLAMWCVGSSESDVSNFSFGFHNLLLELSKFVGTAASKIRKNINFCSRSYCFKHLNLFFLVIVQRIRSHGIHHHEKTPPFERKCLSPEKQTNHYKPFKKPKFRHLDLYFFCVFFSDSILWDSSLWNQKPFGRVFLELVSKHRTSH